MSIHCVVKNCTNGRYKLIKWRQKICIAHGVLREDPECLFGKPKLCYVYNDTNFSKNLYFLHFKVFITCIMKYELIANH